MTQRNFGRDDALAHLSQQGSVLWVRPVRRSRFGEESIGLNTGNYHTFAPAGRYSALLFPPGTHPQMVGVKQMLTGNFAAVTCGIGESFAVDYVSARVFGLPYGAFDKGSFVPVEPDDLREITNGGL